MDFTRYNVRSKRRVNDEIMICWRNYQITIEWANKYTLHSSCAMAEFPHFHNHYTVFESELDDNPKRLDSQQFWNAFH